MSCFAPRAAPRRPPPRPLPGSLDLPLPGNPSCALRLDHHPSPALLASPSPGWPVKVSFLKKYYLELQKKYPKL